MNYYVVAFGTDCDGTPVKNEDMFSAAYDSLDKANTACEDAAEWSDGIQYLVLDEKTIQRNYAPEFALATEAN